MNESKGVFNSYVSTYYGASEYIFPPRMEVRVEILMLYVVKD